MTTALAILVWAVVAGVIGLTLIVLVGAAIGVARYVRHGPPRPTEGEPARLRPVQNWTQP